MAEDFREEKLKQEQDQEHFSVPVAVDNDTSSATAFPKEKSEIKNAGDQLEYRKMLNKNTSNQALSQLTSSPSSNRNEEVITGEEYEGAVGIVNSEGEMTPSSPMNATNFTIGSISEDILSYKSNVHKKSSKISSYFTRNINNFIKFLSF